MVHYVNIISTWINLQQANTTSFSASVYFNVLRSNAVPTAKTIKKSRYVNLDTATHSAGANES